MKVRVGSIVMVRGGFGLEPAARGVVTEVSDDINNGLPGIGYTETETKDDRWAYNRQITQVVQY